MTSMHFIGLDIHKKTISYCVKDVSGTVQSEGTLLRREQELDDWVKTLPPVDRGDGSNHVYRLDLRPSSAACGSGEGGASADVAGDRSGQEEERPHRCRKICDCLRCDFLPECHMVSAEVRERRGRYATASYWSGRTYSCEQGRTDADGVRRELTTSRSSTRSATSRN